MALSWTGDELFYKMADVYSSNAWELFFNSRLSVLDGCDSVPHIFGEGNVRYALRAGCVRFTANLSLAVDQSDSESEAFLHELLQNYQLLHIELSRLESST